MYSFVIKFCKFICLPKKRNSRNPRNPVLSRNYTV